MKVSSLAVAVGRGSCGEIILGTAESSKHEAHRKEWITRLVQISTIWKVLEMRWEVGEVWGGEGGFSSPDKSRRWRVTGWDKSRKVEASSIKVVSRK